jgi:lipoate-protein ligase A
MCATWRLILSGCNDAAENMAIDEAIADSVRARRSPLTLRLYGWGATAVSIGAFQSINDIDCAYCAAHHIPIVRRPTGGRGILHGDELTYSFSSPAGYSPFGTTLREAYQALSRAFSKAFLQMGLSVSAQDRTAKRQHLLGSPLCFQSVSYGECTVDGLKIIGSAQKRWHNGFLQQGSIPFSFDHERAQAIFRKQLDALHAGGLRALVDNFESELFQALLISAFEETFMIRFAEAPLSPEESEHARFLAEKKYRSAEWTESRIHHQHA